VSSIENPTPVRESIEHGGLAIDVLRAEGTCVVELVGELDLDAVSMLEGELGRLMATRNGTTLIVDLKSLTFIDSAGLQCLLQSASAAESDGDALRFRGATGHVEQLLELTDIKKQLRFIG
jgi:anti-anti-sigma factor